MKQHATDYQPFDNSPVSPSLALPKGSIDSHMHVFGPQTDYAYTEDRTYTPTEALLEDYLRMARQVGIDRTVVVQPSVYGTDNSATRHAIKRLGPANGRGVAVVDASISEAELQAMHKDGFRGIRINMLFKGGVDFDTISTLAKLLADLQWHIQFLVDISDFEQPYERLSTLPTDIVIDHMGHMSTDKGLNHSGFQSLLKLLDTGKCWVKLSGPYRFTIQEMPPYDDVTPIAQALVHANPQRMVWGSDWPHPHIPVPMPNDGTLVDMLNDWVPNPSILHNIMVDNPKRLYDF